MTRPKSVAAFTPSLPLGFERLLNEYREHCAKNGLRPGSIAQSGQQHLFYK
jgi:hypothetical protein